MKALTFLRNVLLTTLFFFLIKTSVIAQTPPSDLNGEELKSWLITNYYDGNHQTLGYSTARVYLYNYIDNENNTITGVYSGYEVSSPYGGTTTYPAPINCEHTIPQSYFGEADPMVSDLHHLYPTYENWNSTRSNYPFAEIDDNTTAKWMYLNQSQTTIPTSNIDLYSEYANSTFEPREDHKGNVARSIFYFYTVYPTQAGNISQIGDINTFYQWHLDDPVDAAEIERNGQIETYQGDRNPYIDYPELVARAWGFSTDPTVPSATTLNFSSTSTAINLSWNDVSNENGYQIYKSTNGSSYSLLIDLAANNTSYSDNSVSEGITYYYYILAYNDEGNSNNSNIVSGELNSGSTGTGISVSEALAQSEGTDLTVDGIVTESFNGIYALIMQDIDGTETIVVKLEADQRDEWSPENNPSVVGMTIEVVGTRDSYSSQPSIEYVSSITEIGGTTPDTEAPTAPTSLIVSNISQNSLDLSWNASTDNIGVTGYDVYQGASIISNTTSTSYSVSGLTANTSYSFYIKAKDAAGNVSAASNTTNATTLEDIDTEAPTAPTSLIASNITQNTIDLSWNASSDNVGVTGYDVYEGGSYLSSTTATSYDVSGLTANTTYSFYVKAKDAAGNASSASSTINATTLDNTITYCSSQGSDASYEWIAGVQIGSFNNTSGSAGYTDYTTMNVNVETGNTAVTLTPGFSGSTYNEYWKIWIDLNNDGDFDDTDELVFDAGTMSSSSVSGTMVIPGSAEGVTSRMRVAMKYDGAPTTCETFSYGEVEDYTVTISASEPDTETPTAPTGLTASSIATTSLILSWNASSDNVGVDSYDVYRNGSLIANISTTSYTVSGLSASTTYSFYIIAKDAAGNASAASSTFYATTTNAVISYCDSYGTNTSDEWIEGFVLANLSNTSGNNNGYADYTSMTANVSAGSTYNVTFYTGYSGRVYKEAYAIWIDYNHDGEFDESSELAFTDDTRSTTLTGSITIPSNALSGTTRMRVSMQYNKAASPCDVFTYGEVEDYTINISASQNTSPLADLMNSEIIEYSIYPSPASTFTNFAMSCTEDIENITIRVIDLQGRILIKENLEINSPEINTRLDLTNLRDGLYLVHVSSNKFEITERITIK
jgi:chitodextrinase